MKGKKVHFLPELGIRKFPEIKFYRTEENTPYLDITYFMSSHDNKFWDKWLDFVDWSERNKKDLCKDCELSDTIIQSDM